MVSPIEHSLLSTRSLGSRMKSRSLLASPASQKTNALGGTLAEVSTILGGGSVIQEGLASARLGDHTFAIAGDIGRVRRPSDSTGLLAPGDGGIGRISRRAG